MVSDKHKFIFIHIPKCGGTSIEWALLRNENVNAPENLKDLRDEDKQKYKIYYNLPPPIFTAAQHIGIGGYSGGEGYFTFAFVRNPWARFLSEYFYLQKENGGRCYVEDFNREFPTFKDFVKKDGLQCCYWAHDQLQISFVLDTKQNKLVDFIGRFEDMQYDFDYVCGKIGIPKIKLPHLNKSKTKQKHYTEYYDDETRDIVANLCKKDIEYFGYEFGE